MNFVEAENFLNNLMLFGVKLGLEQIREFLDRLGAPDKELRFIHIAGSNGKGSASSMLQGALRESGFKVGFYSSPHLVSVRERFRINGQAVSEEKFSCLVSLIEPVVLDMRQNGHSPTYFEVTTAIAALYFKQENVDFVVWETGMGGRLDATNIVEPACSVITGISLEHKEHLGDTIEKVALEKAGIIKTGVPVFINQMNPVAESVIKRVALDKQASLNQVPYEWFECEAEYTEGQQRFSLGGYDVKLGLSARFQRWNAALAVLVLEYLAERYDFCMQKAISGFAEVRWPGRQQLLPDGSVLDGAHNSEGARMLVDSLKASNPEQKFTVIYGSLAGKDIVSILEILNEIAEKFIFVPVAGPRGCCSADKLCEMLKQISSVESQASKSIDDALVENSGCGKLICGSLYLAGSVLKKYYNIDRIINI